MKPRLSIFVAVLTLASFCGLAAEPASATGSVADPDGATFEQATHPTPSAKDTDFAGRMRWGMMFVQGILTTGQNFYHQHPNDPRRWDCVVQMANQFGSWTGGINGHEDGKKAANAGLDEAARAPVDRQIAGTPHRRDRDGRHFGR